MCCVCECYKGGIVVMMCFDVNLEDGRFICSDVCKGATSEMGKYLFNATNVWWCAQYFIIASCG